MRVAIIHDWLTGMRGGERCLDIFCELFPEADIYTLVHRKGSVSEGIEKHRIRTSFIQGHPFGQSHYRYFLPLFPAAAEHFNLKGYGLILSSSHCVAKNVRVPNGARHIAYVYTPMRYIWDQFDAYFGPGRAAWPVRCAVRLLRPWLQRKDVASSRTVHYFVAISKHVADRVRMYYGRDASVIHPPVDVQRFSPSAIDGGYYLMVTAFAPYKRVDVAIEAFNRIRLPLRIIGCGQEEERLRRLAGPNIEFCGWRSDREVEQAYANCTALIFPGEEDFGIVPVEAMAAGKPVIAYGKGGVLETVVPHSACMPTSLRSVAGDAPPTGVFFHEQTPDALTEAIRFFQTHREDFDPLAIHHRARPFDRQRFKSQFQEFLTSSLADSQRQGRIDAN